MKKIILYLALVTVIFAQGADLPRVKALIDLEHILATLVYSVIGILVMVLSFAIIDWLHPRDIWGEIADKHNRAMAIMIGCMMLGIAIIIAAAVAS